ncbi:hypothetical protein K474DRAFT_1737380 [Panus rudis PR-1116 ss-1]|nr:hypothetical protein K474DRAFT_1737380 [Panus rudis PR-1116 ss-1]
MEASSSNTTPALQAHEIRITSHGKIKGWVDFALNFLDEHPDQAITLHTLPSDKKQSENQDEESNSDASSKMPASMSTIPRLISVAEIIKREYVKKLDADQAEAGSLTGLHQYNELGTLPEQEPAEPQDREAARLEALSTALQGKKHLKRKHVAYMKITLSRKRIPDLRSQGTTYQEPVLRRLSKSARMRQKRRQKKAAEAEPSSQ